MKIRTIAKLFSNHQTLMMIGCVVTMLSLAMLSYAGILGSWGIYALLIACALSHVLVMRHMRPDTQRDLVQNNEKYTIK